MPPNRLLDSGIDPVVMPCPQDLLLLDLIRSEIILGSTAGLGQVILGSTAGLGQVTAHHFYVGIVFITRSLIGIRYHSMSEKIPIELRSIINSWHAQLSMNLAIAGSCCIAFAHAMYAIPMYPYCASDYPTVLCLF